MSDTTIIDAEARRRILATTSHTAPFMQAAPPPEPPDPATIRARLRADQEAAVVGMEELRERLQAGRAGWGPARKPGRAVRL